MEGVSGFPVTGSKQGSTVCLCPKVTELLQVCYFFPVSFVMQLQPQSCAWITQEVCELMKEQLLLTFSVERESSGGGYKQKVRMFVHEVAEIMVVCVRG